MTLLDTYSQDLPKISLTLSMWKKAKDFADRQTNYQKAQQVYLNTLAVLSVNQYLQRAGIATDLDNSNGCNLAMQTMLDNAELNLPQYGVIDCRPIELSEQVLRIPDEISSTAIAHLAVAIGQNFRSAQIFGFTPQIKTENIPLQELQPLGDLPRFLESSQSRAASQIKKSQPARLGTWFTRTAQEGWSDLTSQVIQQLNLACLESSERSPAFRNSTASAATITDVKTKNNLREGISKVKLWELSQQGQTSKIAIIVNFAPTSGEEVNIAIRLFPTGNNLYLPVGVIIKILDDSDKTILQVETTSNNDKIELYLSGKPQEIFTVQGIYDHHMQTEKFVI